MMRNNQNIPAVTFPWEDLSKSFLQTFLRLYCTSKLVAQTFDHDIGGQEQGKLESWPFKTFPFYQSTSLYFFFNTAPSFSSFTLAMKTAALLKGLAHELKILSVPHHGYLMLTYFCKTDLYTCSTMQISKTM